MGINRFRSDILQRPWAFPFTSRKTCSVCGNIYQELKRDEEEWTCPSCKTKHDRDVNAARNIRQFALIKSLGKDFSEA